MKLSHQVKYQFHWKWMMDSFNCWGGRGFNIHNGWVPEQNGEKRYRVSCLSSPNNSEIFHTAIVCHTVDGQNPAPPRDDNHPIIYRVLTIPGGAGFQPSTVGMVFFENSYTDNSVEKTLLLNSSHKTIHQESETLKKTKQHESPLSHHQNLYLILLVP